METQGTQQTFKRKARIGINPITIQEGETLFLHILSEKPEVFTKKDGDTVDFVMAVNMQTGEEGHFWLAGSLRHSLTDLVRNKGTIEGLKIEVKHLGQKTVEIDGAKQKVNQFDLYELN